MQFFQKDVDFSTFIKIAILGKIYYSRIKLKFLLKYVQLALLCFMLQMQPFMSCFTDRKLKICVCS